jgi:uncharacterized pyridoxamine 5'-phosphate oxidase family protein
MKTKIGFIAAILLLNIISASTQNLFKRLADNDKITTVYITKALLNMIPGMAAKVDVEGVNLKKIIPKLEQIEIYTTNDKRAAQLIRTEAEKLQSTKSTYEVLMRIKENGQDVVFCAEKTKENNVFQSLVMFVDSPDECTLIRLLGNFTAKDIQDITKK